MIFLVGLIPVVMEIIFDKGMWKLGKDDKPWSTFIRLGLFFTLSALYAIETDVYWWQAFGMLFAIHFLLFDYIINKIRNQSFFYVSDSNHWYEKFRRWFKTPVFELMFKIWLLLVAYGVYAHLDWII